MPKVPEHFAHTRDDTGDNLRPDHVPPKARGKETLTRSKLGKAGQRVNIPLHPTADHREALAAFFEKRPGEYQGQ